jgi:hypothetical protein
MIGTEVSFKEGVMETKDWESKIFGLGKAPTFDSPYLDSSHHKAVGEAFQSGRNAVYDINNKGEVEFFILLPDENLFDGILAVQERMSLTLQKNKVVALSVNYAELDMMESPFFQFRLDQVMDRYCLEWLSRYEVISLYYMVAAEADNEGEYVCVGLKTLSVPFTLWYDMTRYVDMKGALRAPCISPGEVSDRCLTGKLLVSPAVGFYVDFSRLVQRFGSEDNAEEVFHRHFLHGLSRIQFTRRKEIREQPVYIWVNKQVALGSDNRPSEMYSVFLQVQQQHFEKSKDALYSLFSACFDELPEFAGSKSAFPLEEEGIPAVVIEKGSSGKFRLTREFFWRAKGVFQDRFAKHRKYKSCYERLMNFSQEYEFSDKVVHLLKMKPEGERSSIPAEAEFENRDTQRKYMEEIYKSCPEILEKLSVADKESEKVKEALILLGDAIFPCILPLLSDSREQVRVNAVEIMGLLGSARALNAVMSMPKDISADVESRRAWIKDLYLWRNP